MTNDRNPIFTAVRSPASLRRRGLTLVEMLIGMAITLIMMAAVVNLFANMGAGVRIRRASMEMSAELRTARSQLFQDLAGATCPAIPWREPGNDEGYLEIIEGQYSERSRGALVNGNTVADGDAYGELNYQTSLVPSAGDPNVIPPADGSLNAVTNGGALGDYDDILMLTVKNENEPFVGRGLVWDATATNGGGGYGAWVPGIIESKYAEVIWYAVENPADGSLGEPGMRTVYRRVLLIAPWIDFTFDSTRPSKNVYWNLGSDQYDFPSGASIDERLLDFYRRFDISARFDGTSGQITPNSLGDLTKRENRFAHQLNSLETAPGWPFVVERNAIRDFTFDPMFGPLRPFGAPFDSVPAGSPDRRGEDVVLTNVLSFDLRVFDPGAPVITTDGGLSILEPANPGWGNAVANIPPNQVTDYGAFVDLGWGSAAPASTWPEVQFFQPRLAGWHPRQPTLLLDYPAVYDTWSWHYETNGLDEDGVAGVDQGTNGFDDNTGAGAVNGTDDPGERETSPPYDIPLEAMQVKLRIYDPDTRQIRAATVTRNFDE